MAPEQRERPSDVDHRADIYALGVVLYQMLTGELPDEKQLLPPSHRVRLDVRLDEIVLRALEHEPSRRYSSAIEFKTRVESFGSTPPPMPAGEAPAESPPPPSLPAAALRQVRPAAFALRIAGMLNLGGLLVRFIAAGFATLVAHLIAGNDAPFSFLGAAGLSADGTVNVFLAATLGWLIVHAAVAGLALCGSGRMLRLRRRRTAIVAAGSLGALGSLDFVFSVSPLLPSLHRPWGCLELGIGAWALVVLFLPGVRTAFDSVPPELPHNPADPNSSLSPQTRVAGPASGLLLSSALQLLALGTAWVFVLFFITYHFTEATDALRLNGTDTTRLDAFGYHSIYQSVTPGYGMGPRWLSFARPALVLLTLAALISFVAGWRMRRLRGHGLALTGSLLSVLTLQGFGLGLVTGIRALRILWRGDIHAAFDQGRPRSRRLGTLLAIAAVLALAGLWAVACEGTRLVRQADRHALGPRIGPLPSFDYPSPPRPGPSGSPGFSYSEENTRTVALDAAHPSVAIPLAVAPIAQRRLLTVQHDTTTGSVSAAGSADLAFQPVAADQWDKFTDTGAYFALGELARGKKPPSSIGTLDASQTLLFVTRSGPAGVLRLVLTRPDAASARLVAEWKFFQVAPALPSPLRAPVEAPADPVPLTDHARAYTAFATLTGLTQALGSSLELGDEPTSRELAQQCLAQMRDYNRLTQGTPLALPPDLFERFGEMRDALAVHDLKLAAQRFDAAMATDDGINRHQALAELARQQAPASLPAPATPPAHAPLTATARLVADYEHDFTWRWHVTRDQPARILFGIEDADATGDRDAIYPSALHTLLPAADRPNPGEDLVLTVVKNGDQTSLRIENHPTDRADLRQQLSLVVPLENWRQIQASEAPATLASDYYQTLWQAEVVRHSRDGALPDAQRRLRFLARLLRPDEPDDIQLRGDTDPVVPIRPLSSAPPAGPAR